MFYKVLDEDGNYLDSEGVTMNLLSCIKFDAPAGSELAIGWIQFDSEFEAMDYYQLTKIPTPEEIEILI